MALLGAGLHGEVKTCQVAIKYFMRREAGEAETRSGKDLFQNELSALRRLQGTPHVVRLLGWNEDQCCIFMELCSSTTLEAVLSGCSPARAHDCDGRCSTEPVHCCRKKCLVIKSMYGKQWLQQLHDFCEGMVRRSASHLDLKAKNIVFKLLHSGEPDFANLVVIDFASSVVDSPSPSKHSPLFVWSADPGELVDDTHDELLVKQIHHGISFLEALNGAY
eukprot:127136-Hanusia_phi.AAC.1